MVFYHRFFIFLSVILFWSIGLFAMDNCDSLVELQEKGPIYDRPIGPHRQISSNPNTSHFYDLRILFCKKNFEDFCSALMPHISRVLDFCLFSVPSGRTFERIE